MTNKADTEALDELAARVGVEHEFQDAKGEMVRTEAATKRRLLAALGFQVDNDADIHDEIRRLDDSEWRLGGPPVAVCYAGEKALVDFDIVAGNAQVSWSIHLEDGNERSGQGDRVDLHLIATRNADGATIERRQLALPADLPVGYHRLTIGETSPTALIIAPRQCWLPPGFLEGRGFWGLAVQLYLVRGARDWGIGSFGELHMLADMAGARGADVIGLNPLHALFPDEPEQASPYSPASRLLLNFLYIDVDSAVESMNGARTRDMIADPGFQRDLARLRRQPHVPYVEVAAHKLRLLRSLFDECSADPDASRAAEEFRRQQGQSVERHCLFLALRLHMRALNAEWADWRSWPQQYRDCHSPTVMRFAQEHAVEVGFWMWMQQLAERQLEEAARKGREAGMRIGLYRDLAVGADPAGAETWSNPHAVLSGIQVGAPPDIYNPAGQNWGLAAFHPKALREAGYRPFIELLRANMRHAGALRIDHAMLLQHLYFIPSGEKPKAGAYVRYNLDEMIAIIALESQRNECLVIGEDLGTVPEGFREKMAAANILSYRILFFEETDEGFIAPADYPQLALAVAGNHDLPTLLGWWEDRDLKVKDELGFLPGDDEIGKQMATRRKTREKLLQGLEAEGLIEAGAEIHQKGFTDAAHRFLARTRSGLAMAQLDDLTGEADQVNVPGATTEYPNWRRRLSATLHEIAASKSLDDLAEIFTGEGGVHA